jgi:predicted protein tyrosine phosphatase
MPRIHVCSLPLVEATARTTGAKRLVTLLNPTPMQLRPASIRPEDHLFLGVSDIVEPQEGLIAPGAEHIRSLLEFARAWDRAAPMIIHCFAGVSRSTAAAFISVCALAPARDEAEVARLVRERSPTATPNLRLVRLADEELGRGGRMVRAIEAIGRGIDCEEGEPFALEISPTTEQRKI